MSERLPYAAKRLIEQVEAIKPRTSVQTVGDVDGLGVYRTIRFNKATSKWLAPLLESIEDPRVAGFHLTDRGYLHVTFVPGPLADNKARFFIEEADLVARSND